jgi:hypothetical protein
MVCDELEEPPKVEPMEAPFPACRSTAATMTRLTRTWMIRTRVNMNSSGIYESPCPGQTATTETVILHIGAEKARGKQGL